MGVIQELEDFVTKFQFVDIVHEYEQGLYFFKGRVIEKQIKWFGKELDEITADEKKVISDCGGYIPLMIPTLSRCQKKIPENYKKSFVLGLPMHPKRFERKKVLEPGVYFYLPFINRMVVESCQEDVLDVENTCYIADDKEILNINVSCNIRWKLLDLYRAFTIVTDYKKSLKKHAKSVLSEAIMGKTVDYWRKDPKENMKNLKKQVLEDLRKIVTEDWGIKIYDVSFTDIGVCSIQRVMHEGILSEKSGGLVTGLESLIPVTS